MATLNTLQNACSAEPAFLLEQAQQQASLWDNWLQPVTQDRPAGEDPGYDDNFQQIREEVNKLSGADTSLTCELAENLLIGHCKDVRVATYYIWARLHRDGETGLADGLSLLAGLISRFGETLHPLRSASRKASLEWLSGSRVLDSLSLFPEVDKTDFSRIVGALSLIEQGLNNWESDSRPQFGALYAALENRLAQSGGFDAVIPQNSSAASTGHTSNTSADSPTLKPVTSGRDLLDQAKLLAKYLRDQPSGWLSGHHLIKSIRLDTLHELPPLAADGRTRLSPPKPEHRALLKRLYLQQSWLELLEQTDSLFALGVNHLWLDLQWYIHQALVKAGAPYETWADMIKQDLNGLLTRLPGLEGLAFDDGTPFADEVTLNWINQQVMTSTGNWGNEPSASATTAGDDDILQLEPEALTQADSGGVEAALNWLQNRPGTRTPRHQWLLRLLMARVAEQYGKNDMALHLVGELDNNGSTLTLTQWEPELLFEVKARRLKLLRMKASRADTDKSRLHVEMEHLIAGLIALDPARAAVLCG
jgi:type VI secretion system protein VasJ